MRKKDRFMTFAEQEHRAYVKDAFNLLLVMSCFICLSQALFSVPVPAVFDRFRETTAVICLRQGFAMLYQGVALYAPFLIFAVVKNRSAGRYFSCKNSEASAGHYILGSLSVMGIGVCVWYLSSFIVSSMRDAGYIINENLPLLGNSPVTYVSFVVFSAIIPAFFTEITFRGIVMTEIKKDSYVFAVIIAALINSFSHLSFLQMPYIFLTGLISGWLCLKAKTIMVSYIANGLLNGLIAVLYVIKSADFSLYDSVMPFIALAGAIIGLVCLAILFSVYGFKVERNEKGFSVKDSLKAFFGAFGLWILIFITVFEVFFLYIKKPKEESESELPVLTEIYMDER